MFVVKMRYPPDGIHASNGYRRTVIFESLSSDFSDAKVFLDGVDLGGSTCVCGFVVVSTGHGVVHFDVELDLGFCAGGAYGNFGVVFCEELQHVGGDGHIHLLYLSGAGVGEIEIGIVLDYHNGAATELLGRVGTEILHHLHDFFSTGLALDRKSVV